MSSSGMHPAAGVSTAVSSNRRRALFVAAGLTLVFAVLHQVFVSRAHPDALYMDSLRLLHQVREWQQGRMSFVELWGLGSAHRGFINPLMLMANVRFFSLDVMLANRLTGAVVAMVAFALAYAFNRQVCTQKKVGSTWVCLLASLLIVAACFSWAGFELFTLDLGLPLWTKNLCFVLFFIAHGRYLAIASTGTGMQRLAALGLGVAGVLIVMFVGMGWSYAFAGALVGVQGLAMVSDLHRRLPAGALAWRTLPLAAVLLALAWSLAQGASGGRVEDGASFSRLAGSLPELGGLVLHALGAAWIGVDTLQVRGIPLTAAPLLGLGGLVAAALGVADRLRRGLYSGSLLPLYLVGYGLLTALSVAAARGEGGSQAVMASRYYMDVVLFLMGVLWLGAEAVVANRPRTSSAIATGLFLGLAATVVMGLVLTGDNQWKAAPYRARMFEAMNEALRQGVPDAEAANLLQSPLDPARAGATILREQRLALFAGGPVDACVLDGIARSGDWYADEAGGRWMGQSAALMLPAGCACDLVADLYIPEDFTARHLVIGSGAEASTLELQPGRSVHTVLLARQAMAGVQLSVSEVTVPEQVFADSDDVRSLGVFWTGVGFACYADGNR